MKRLLYPAIALMDRLSFGLKFSLISTLFFVPMLVTSFYPCATSTMNSTPPASSCRAWGPWLAP